MMMAIQILHISAPLTLILLMPLMIFPIIHGRWEVVQNPLISQYTKNFSANAQNQDDNSSASDIFWNFTSKISLFQEIRSAKHHQWETSEKHKDILNFESSSSVQEKQSVITTSVSLAHTSSVDDNRMKNDFHLSSSEDEYSDEYGKNEILPSFLDPSHMVLCYHPPTKFSPKFLTHSEDKCLEKDFLNIEVDSTLSLCELIYYNMYGKHALYSLKTIGNYTNLKSFIDENFIAVCLPFFQRFNHCEKRKFLTVCFDEEVIFFNFSVCQRPSAMDIYFIPLLIESLLEEDEYCFNYICDGTFRVIDSKVNDIPFRLIKLSKDIPTSEESCSYLFNSHANWQSYNESTIHNDANIYFPCCYFLYNVLWVGKPEESGLNSNWDFLPLSCQVSEVLLVSAAACIAVVGVVGNMLVVVVMVSGGHRGQESSMIRTSLAIADLLIGIFVVIPSVTYQFSLIVGNVNSEEQSWYYLNISEGPTLEFYVIREVNSGYRLFQAFVFSLCSLVSLLSLLLLSVERFILTSRSIEYNAYFSVTRTKVAIGLIWVMSFTDTLLFMYDGNGHFNARWSTITKIPVGILENKSQTLLYWSLYLRLIFLILICTFTFIFSCLAIIYFICEQKRVALEWKILNMKVTDKLHEENLQIIITMTLMTLLFCISVLPLSINICFNIIDYTFHWDHLFTYLSWWLFLAGGAWNPWIYNMRSSQFRKSIKTKFKTVNAKLKSIHNKKYEH
ncbi:uncharacterized protein [Cherax quadricarinatus]